MLAIVGLGLMLASVLGFAFGIVGCAGTPEQSQWPPTFEIHGGGGEGWLDFSVNGQRQTVNLGSGSTEGCIEVMAGITVEPWGSVEITGYATEKCGFVGVSEVSVTPFRRDAGIPPGLDHSTDTGNGNPFPDESSPLPSPVEVDE